MKFKLVDYNDVFNDLWRLLGVPVLNFCIVTILFYDTFKGPLAKYIGYISPIAQSSIERLNELNIVDYINNEKISDIVEKGLDASFSVIFVIFSLSVVLIFLIDVATKTIGYLFPLKIGVNQQNLVKIPELNDDFRRVLNSIEAEKEFSHHIKVDEFIISRFDAWQIVHSRLDANENIKEYYVINGGIDKSNNNLKLMFLYVKSYIVLSIISSIIKIISSSSLEIGDFAIMFFILIVLVFSLICIGANLVMNNLSAMRNDLKTFFGLNFRIDAEKIKKFQDEGDKSIYRAVYLKFLPGFNGG